MFVGFFSYQGVNAVIVINRDFLNQVLSMAVKVGFKKPRFLKVFKNLKTPRKISVFHF